MSDEDFVQRLQTALTALREIQDQRQWETLNKKLADTYQFCFSDLDDAEEVLTYANQLVNCVEVP